MLKITVENEDISITVKCSNSYTKEDAADLFESALTMMYQEDVKVNLEDTAYGEDTIWCEGEEPAEEREIDGL